MHDRRHAVRTAVAFAPLLFALGCAGNPATSDRRVSAAQSPVPGQTYVAADGRELRCIYEAETGQRVRKRICRTVDEWKQIEEASQDYGRAMQGPLTKLPDD